MTPNSNSIWWLKWLTPTSDLKLLPSAQLSTSLSQNLGWKNNYWQWLSMLRRMNSKFKSKNSWRSRTSSRSFWMNLNPHYWKNSLKPTLLQSLRIKNLLPTLKKPKLLLFLFQNNLRRQRKLRSSLMPRESCIDLWLEKEPCSISCVFPSALLITCISIPWSHSLSSSSKPLKGPKKRTKLEFPNWLKTFDIQSTSGFLEACLKSTSLFSSPWSPSGWWAKKLLKLPIMLTKWTSWSKVFPESELKILLTGSQIQPGIWFKL